jgi:hypothetical protein
MFKAVDTEVLARLNKTWPKALQLPFEADSAPDITGHPLAGELLAFTTGGRASLPFFSGDRIAWFTLAGDADQLRAAIEDLRAWILPSFGWEDETQPLVAPGEATGDLGPLIHSLSPAGYFRWWAARTSFKLVVKKLRAMRQLEEAQPAHIYEYVPSLFELRQQFEVALLTGARESAQGAIDSIDHNQLDTAANSRFMQIRLWDQFREHEQIATTWQIAEIVQLRMPHAIRLALVRAFHAHFLASQEQQGDIQAAALSYAANVHDLLAGVLEACRPSDGIEVLRSVAYKAWLQKDGNLATRLMAESEDKLVKELLSPLRAPAVAPPPLEDQFMDSWRQGDWRTLQEVGQLLLESSSSGLSILTSDYLLSTLAFSLNLHANSILAQRLETVSVQQPSKVPAIFAAQTWCQFVERLKVNDWGGADHFLSLEERPSLDGLKLNEISQVLESLEGLFTDPKIDQDQTGRQVMLGSLPVIIKDFLNDPEFPRSSLTGIYRQLFQLWAQHRRGGASQQDANLLLALAEPVLQLDSSSEKEVAESIRGWWEARRVRAMLPFLLSALDLLSELTSDRGVCESLWIDGAEFIRIDPQALSPGERVLWRNVGRRIGLDVVTIEEFLGLHGEADTGVVDVLAQVKLKKVAIVSLREEPARIAAEIIRQRTGAQVAVVTETHAGAATGNAQTADVVLFVWASTTHAVYRAFDNIREKLAYVEGKGAVSIVLTLERWAMKQQELSL